jgi:predicted AAA+ superfamily ATPase
MGKIRILVTTLGNDYGDEIEIDQENMEEIYYTDGLGRWCYFEKSQQEKYFEYVKERE